jgi:hypothetical protein
MPSRTPRRFTLAAVFALLIALLAAVVVPIAASAVGPGSITGVVTLSTGKAAKSVTVQAIELGTDRLVKRKLATVTTSSTGTFTVPSVDPGTYVLQFSGASGYFTQYLGGSGTLAGAQNLTVTSNTATFVRAPLAASGTASVTVKGLTGKAVKGVVVTSYTLNDLGQWTPGAKGTTSSSGVAKVSGLEPGTHRFGIYSSTGAVPQLYSGNVQRMENATDVEITAGATTPFAFAAPTTGGVTGVLRNTGGTGVGGVKITVVSFGGHPGSFFDAQKTSFTTVTSSSGVFAISGLLPRYYTLKFEPAAVSDYGSGYYGDTQNAYAATSFLISAGSTLTLNDAVVQNEGSASGVVQYYPGFTPQANVPIFAWPGYEAADYNQSAADIVALTAADGTFQVTGLAPGAWSFLAGSINPEIQNNPAYNALFGTDIKSVTIVAGVDTPLSGQLFVNAVSDTTNPSVLTPASVTGTYKVGSELTMEPAVYDWPSDPTPAQWLRDGRAIPGAVGATYTLVSADYGHYIAARQTSNFSYKVHRTAVTTGQSIALGDAPVRDGSPAVSAEVIGAIPVGHSISLLPGTWDRAGVSYSYGWCVDNSGDSICDGPYIATGQSFSPTGAYIGSDILGQITATRTGYEPGVYTVFAGTVAQGTFGVTTAPKVTKSGSTLTVSTGTWSPSPTVVNYLWQWRQPETEDWHDAGVYINKLNVAGLVGKAVRVTVSVNKDGVANNEVTVLAQTGTAAAPTGDLTLPASYTPPATATAPSPTWPSDLSGADTELGYQWQYKSGSSWKSYSGATSSTLPLTETHVGKYIRVVITARSAGYTTKTLTTNAAFVNTMAAPTMPGGFSVSGGPSVVGATLTVAPTAWNQSGVTTGYLWQYSNDLGNTWVTISGATKSKYTIPEKYFDKWFRALVTGTKAGHTKAQINDYITQIAEGDLTLASAGSIKLSKGKWVLTPPSAKQGSAGRTYTWYTVDPSSGAETEIRSAGTVTSVPFAESGAQYLRVDVVLSRPGYGYLTAKVYGAQQSGLSVGTPGTLSYETGTPKVSQEISVSTGTWNGFAPDSYSYQWYYNTGSAYKKITGATSSTFVPSAFYAGKTVIVYVTGNRGGYTPLTFITNDSGVISAGNSPLPSTLPEVVGAAKIGVTMKVTPATGWDVPGVTVSYQWERAIDSWVLGTKSTFSPPATENGQALKLRVTASAPGRSNTVYLLDAGTVVSGTLSIVKAPTVTKKGSTLTTTAGTWSAPSPTADIVYSIYDRMSGTTVDVHNSKLSLAGLSGVYILVSVSTTKSGYTAGYTEKVAQYGSAAIYTGSGAVERTDNIMSAYTVGHASSWDMPGLTTHYVWKRNGKVIAGAADGYTYTLQSADIGATISVTITKSKDGYKTATKTFTYGSKPDLVEPFTSTAAPVISGTSVVGGSLKGTNGSWSVAKPTFTYQWYVLEPSVAVIPGATTATWKPTAEFAGRSVALRVTASKTYYESVTQQSNALVVAVGAPATVSSQPTISLSSNTLTVKIGTVTPGYTVTAQWYTVDGAATAIPGATGLSIQSVSDTTYMVVFTATRLGYETTTFESAQFVRLPDL